MDGRRRSPLTPRTAGLVHVSEPELDMRRDSARPSGAMERLFDLVRRMIFDRARMVSPMRSIGRELEESWPASES